MVGPEHMPPSRLPSIKLTYDDYLNFPDDGRRHELIEGEHYVTPSPDARHQRILQRLSLTIGNYLEAYPIGELFFAPFDVILSDIDVVEPDLLYVSRERASIVQRWVHGAPDLVVEILSPGTRKTDEITKRRLFDRAGVVEYWIIDPELDVVKVYRRAGDATFPRIAELTREASDVLTSPLLPGLELTLEALLR